MSELGGGPRTRLARAYPCDRRRPFLISCAQPARLRRHWEILILTGTVSWNLRQSVGLVAVGGIGLIKRFTHNLASLPYHSRLNLPPQSVDCIIRRAAQTKAAPARSRDERLADSQRNRGVPCHTPTTRKADRVVDRCLYLFKREQSRSSRPLRRDLQVSEPPWHWRIKHR